MIEAKAKSTGRGLPSNRSILITIILVALASLGLYGYNVFRAFRNAAPDLKLVPISQNALEEEYGLRVQHVAVTAAGGLIDVRVQIMDGKKAKTFLSDKANFPALHIGNDVFTRASDVTALQDVQFENGKFIFILYPNPGGIVQPGDSVNVVFGNLQLNAIQSK